MMRRLVLLLLVLLHFSSGCAGDAPAARTGPAAPVPADPVSTGALPLPGELARGASSFQKLLGSQAYARQAGYIDGYTLRLQAPQYFDPGGEDPPPKVPLSVGPARRASATAYRIAYGVFVFSGLDHKLATLEIETGANYKAKLWIGFADWDNNRWDFSAGGFFAHPTIDISNPEEFDRFIDDEGRVAVAVVVDDPIEQVAVHSLEVTMLSEVSELESNNFRWDGVRLSWWAPGTTDGFRILRRAADDTTGTWAEIAPAPLSRQTRSYLDTTAVAGEEYSYLVQSGFLRAPQGLPRWYWSDGVEVNGHCQVSEVAVDTGADGSHLPFLSGNKLGYFSQRALDPGQVDGIRNLTFTPGTSWVPAGTPDNNFTSFALASEPDFGFPLLEHHAEQVNNPIVALVYSTAEGTLAQVAERQADDSLSWFAPKLVRGPATVIVALVNMPRRIGAVTYNKSNGRLELVDSVDSNGRYWYDFDPAGYPWMDIGPYRPVGRVSIDEHTAEPQLCFLDGPTGELKFLRFDYAGWLDLSPLDISCAPGPLLANSAGTLEMPVSVLFYLTPEFDALRALRSDIYGAWLTTEIETLVEAGPEEQLTEFALFTSGQISLESYLVYNLSGRLYAQRSSSTSFKDWTPPVLLDDAGSCRDLQIIKVGTDAQWQVHHYASYIKDTPEGGTVISFRDLYQATMDF